MNASLLQVYEESCSMTEYLLNFKASHRVLSVELRVQRRVRRAWRLPKSMQLDSADPATRTWERGRETMSHPQLHVLYLIPIIHHSFYLLAASTLELSFSFSQIARTTILIISTSSSCFGPASVSRVKKVIGECVENGP